MFEAYVLLKFVCECSDKTETDPIYEIPPPKYTAERILKILLDPSLPTSKVCSVRPTNVVKSSTYVVDITKLEHPDDVKYDNFGTWKHSGSHPLVYRVRVEDDSGFYIERCAPGAVGEDVVYLRRLHSVHPSNSSFKRLIAFISGTLLFDNVTQKAVVSPTCSLHTVLLLSDKYCCEHTALTHTTQE